MRSLNTSKLLRSLYHNTFVQMKGLYYNRRGEPITYGPHHLRFVPGTRPVRLKYVNSPNGTVRNDAKQISFFLERVKPAQLVLDIGANVGQYAVIFASLVTDAGKVISFEPDETSRAIMKKNLALNGLENTVIVEELALSDTAGSRSFFSTGTADANASFLDPRDAADSPKSNVREQIVKTERLDDYLTSRNLRCPDWVKIDTEGAEVHILRGAKEVLKSSAKIVCELHPYAWPQFSTSFEELLDIVAECGRTIAYLDESQSIEDGAFYGAAIIL